MRLAALSFGLFVALGSAGAGVAQEYSPNQVVDFFAKEIELGKTRGICVGTADECGDRVKPAAFDVLVNFELNSALLTPQAAENLSQVATALKDDRLRDAKFVVEGHTDALGSNNYNDTLADERADAVAAYLVAQGVSPDRMTALGLGESAPRVPDPYDPVNRRVEMRLNLE